MRKKFTMLLASLLAFVGVIKADVTDLPTITTDLKNPIYYTIYNTRSKEPGGLMYYAGENVGLKDGCTSLNLEDKYQFFFTGSHDAMYIHNKATDKKLASVASWTEDGTAWAVGVSPKGGGLAFGPKDGLSGDYCWNEKNYKTNETTSDFTTYKADDEGSIFVVELAASHNLPTTNNFYVIECPLFEKVQGVKKGLYVDSEGKLSWNTVELANKNFYWYLAENNGVVSLKNVGTNKYLNGTGFSDNEVNVTLYYMGANNFNIIVNGVTLHAAGHGNGANANGDIVNYGGAAGSSSAWTFVKKNDPNAETEVTVKYNFILGEELVGSQEVATLTGEEYPNIVVPYGVVLKNTKPNGAIDAKDAIDNVVNIPIEVEYNLPFVPAVDYASIKNWYYIQMHSSGGEYTRYIQAMDDYIEWLDVKMNIEEADSYTWGFVGNPFDGFKLVNYGAGETMAVNSNGEGNPALGDFGTGVQWNIKASRVNPDAEHFCFQYPGSNNYMNAQSGKIAFWTDADEGSTMWVTERDLSGATELKALIESAGALVTALSNSTGVGSVTSASLSALSTEISNAQAAAEAKVGCIEAQVALQTVIDALETIQPEEGVFYTLKNNYTDRYMNVNADAGLVATTAVGIGEVFQFVKDNGSLYLKNVERGAYLNTAVQHGLGQNAASATTIAGAKAVVVKNLGKGNQVSITPNGGATLHHDTNNNSVVAWNAGVDSKSSWSIEAVDIAALSHVVSISDVKWASLVLGFNATIPAGVTAHIVSEVTNNSATLEEVTGVLPANTAVLVNAEAGDYEFKYTSKTGSVEGNLLSGTVFNTNVTEDAYILANGDKGLGLYKAKKEISTDTTNDGTEEAPAVTYEAFKNNAFKAYLPASAVANANAPMFSINRGEGTTSIDELSTVNGQQTTVIYDLTGRRVEKMEKGIYIVNGRKVIVK